MNDITDFFSKILDTSDWPPRWHCGNWTDFHGWLYIISDLLIWSAYFAIPFIIIRFITKKHDSRFIRLYFLFAAFILACGATHFLDALTFWVPAYRLNALVRLATGLLSWATVYQLFRILPVAFSLKSASELESEIAQRKLAEDEVRKLNAVLEQRVAEKTARILASERVFRSVIENSFDAVSLTDQNFDPIYANSAAYALTGSLAGEEVKQNWIELVHAEDYEKLKTLLFAVGTHPGCTFKTSFRLMHRKGHYVWVEGSIKNMLNDEIIKAIVFNFRDISEIKNNELNQALFESIINSCDDAIISKDLNGTITTWNNGAERIFGYTDSEAIGRHISILIPPDKQHEDKEILQRILNDEYVRHYETERLTKSGKRIYISLTVSPILDDSGNITGASKIARDITEEKMIREKVVESEKIYRAIATNIPKSIITIMDRNQKFILAEGPGLAQLGYTKNDLEGKTEQEALRADAYERVAAIRELAFSGEAYSHEMIFEDVDMLIRFVPLKNDSGEVYAVMTISIDITDVKQGQRQIQALNESLEQKVAERTLLLENANKELEAFSYSVSHDLRAPLRIINGYADILRIDYTAKLDEEGNRMLEAILANTRQMGHLIDDLLMLSRLGRKELHMAPANMSDIVACILTEQIPFSKKQISITTEQLDTAVCDTALMRHVWANLISNAVKYSGKVEAPTISIGSLKRTNDVVFYIKDNGVGFDMKYSHKLFGVFQRLHKRTEFEGTGIGLALIWRIISRHGGQVWAEAEEHKGATFYFSLPTKNHDHGTTS